MRRGRAGGRWAASLQLPMPYALDGFLGTRASFMLDVVFLAMFALVPVLAVSVWLVMYRQRYLLHKRIQLALGIVLLVTVVLFEIDMRANGWRAGRAPRRSCP